MFDFSITERTYLDPKSSGEAARADCLATKICMGTRFIIDATCAMSWVGLARGAGPSGREIAWIGLPQSGMGYSRRRLYCTGNREDVPKHLRTS